MSEQDPPAPYAIERAVLDRDRDLLFSLWHGNLGTDARMRSKFDWFYTGCPYGEPTVCLLRHVADNRFAGVASAGPRRMLVAGTAIDAGVLVDLAVCAEHRSLGPALMLQTALAESAGARFDLLYGFPNPKAAPVFKRVGYSKLADIVRLARVLRHRSYLERRVPAVLAALAAPLIDLAVRLRDAWRARGNRRLSARWSAAADPGFDALWARSAPVGGVFAIRDHAFAQWRFDQCPFARTRYLLLVDPQDESLHAWFACQVEDGCLHVRDFWSGRAAHGIDRAHVDALLEAARKAGHAAVSVEIASKADRLEGWHAARFSSRSRRPVFGRWTGPQPPAELDLYLTSADEDE